MRGAEAKPARASDRRRFAAREECHGCPGRRLPARGFAYNTRMNRLFDKSIVLACCIAAATGAAVDARLVAAFCLGVIATSLAELAQKERTSRTSEAASYAYIIAAVFVPPFVPLRPSPSMTSRGACAVNAFGSRWALASPLSLHSSRTFAPTRLPLERSC